MQTNKVQLWGGGCDSNATGEDSIAPITRGRPKRRILRFCLVAMLCSFLSPLASAYPTGWVYLDWPFAWSNDAQTWVWLNSQDTQWICNMNTSGWTTFGGGGPRNGWAYFQWPYAWSNNQNAWYYFDTAGSMWLFNYGAQAWERLNKNGPLTGTLSQARDILGTWTGRGSYYTYFNDFFDGAWQTVPYTLVNAQFRFVFERYNDTEIYFVTVTVTPLSAQPLLPDQPDPDLGAWGFNASYTASGSRVSFTNDTGQGIETWAFNFTTDTMAGSVTATWDNPMDWYYITSVGINGITLTRNR